VPGRSARVSAVCKSTTSSTGTCSYSAGEAIARARGLAAAFAVFGLFWGAWAACLPAIQKQTGASEAQLGLALLCVALAALPAMLAAGRLADLFGARLVPIGLVLFGAAATLPGLARSFLQLVLLMLAVGATTGLLDIAINAHASRLEAVRRVRVMDGLHAAFSFGVLVGGIGTGLLRRAGGHPSWILGSVGVVVAFTAFTNRDTSLPPAAAPRRAPIARPLLVVGLVLALAFIVESGLEGWSALFLERVLDSSPAVSGLGPGLFAGAMATGRVLAQRVERSSVPGRMLFAGLAAAAGLVLVATAQHPLAALAGMVVAGAGLALSAPTLFGLAGRLGGEGGRGSALSTVAILGYLGFLAGPALIGAVSGASSLRGGFLFLCAVAVLLAACAPALRRTVGETGG
jgi:MFS family permease